MLEAIASRLRLFIAALLVAMLLQWLVFPAAADERSELSAALAQATAQYRLALKTL
jgi:hypothetical protein